MEHTKRSYLNHGSLKLDLWQRGVDWFELVFWLAGPVSDSKLKSQFTALGRRLQPT